MNPDAPAFVQAYIIRSAGWIYFLLIPLGIGVIAFGLKALVGLLKTSLMPAWAKWLMTLGCLTLGGAGAWGLAYIRVPLRPDEWANGIPFPMFAVRMLPAFGHSEVSPPNLATQLCLLMNWAFGVGAVALLMRAVEKWRTRADR